MVAGRKKKGTEKIPDLGESRQKAAALLKTNRQYVSDAKAIQRQNPHLLDAALLIVSERVAASMNRLQDIIEGNCGDCGTGDGGLDG